MRPSTFKRWLTALAVLFLAGMTAVPSQGHPHSFIEVTLALVFDQEGLAGVRQRWVIDEMTSLTVLDVIGDNLDGRLDETEVQAIREINKQGLSSYNYFTHILINGKDHAVKQVADFDAELDEGKLIYSFFVPLDLKAGDQDTEVMCAVYDDSFFAYIHYTNGEDSGIDPTADPLFANMEAPVSPDDYDRFSSAVGLEATALEVLVEGPTQHLALAAAYGETPEMAYFQGQIIPEAITLRFRRQ